MVLISYGIQLMSYSRYIHGIDDTLPTLLKAHSNNDLAEVP